MNIHESAGLFFIAAAMAFFLSGTVGLLRFPDIYTRLHALTKADNVGLGLLILGLSLQATDWLTVAKLILIWLLVLLARMVSSAQAPSRVVKICFFTSKLSNTASTTSSLSAAAPSDSRLPA